MRFFDSAKVDAALGYPALVDILKTAFRQGAIAPLRHHHAITLDGRPEATLLLMPAWEAKAPGSEAAGRYLGVKTVSVFPDNATRGKPAVFGTYLLLSAETGETLAVMDATRLTTWRTGAASALAARFLARADASRLLFEPGLRCQNGRLAPVTEPDWIRFTEGMIAIAKRTYRLAQTRNKDAVSAFTGDLSNACNACHRTYRDVGGRGRGGPAAGIAGRCVHR